MSVTVIAPGKLVLAGAYAVLHGAPAIVLAVDRYARAEAGRRASVASAEVALALGQAAPHCDASELWYAGRKLGLGSSAAVLVASLGADIARRGQDPEDPDVRSSLFTRARDAHATAQGGGSGVDVAASTYGGALRYALRGGRPWVAPATLPEDLVWTAFYSGTSVRTSELLAQVAELAGQDPEEHDRRMAYLIAASETAADVVEGGSVREIVVALRAYAAALEQLGDAADADIVPLAFRRLAVAAEAEGATFLPSGAGGGDVGVFAGMSAPSETFLARAEQLGMVRVPLSLETGGVRILATPPRAD